MKAAAAVYAQRGWVPLALGPDAKGKPKRPLSLGWSKFTTQTAQPWDDAIGVGILLGPPSKNLAAIDVDDVALSDAVFACLLRGHVETRIVRTVSDHLHVCFYEQIASSSHPFKVEYKGREVGVEFKAMGTQIAAPPTPGYALVGYEPEDKEPLLVPTIAAAWRSIAVKLGLATLETPSPHAEFPKPWASHVPTGDRNRTLYIEAHKLREAGMPEEQAIDILLARWEASYDHGNASERDLRGTIRSAYRKGLPSQEAMLKWQF